MAPGSTETLTLRTALIVVSTIEDFNTTQARLGLAALFPGVGYNDINLTVTVVNVTAPEAGSGSGEVGSGSGEAGRRLADVVERLRVDAVINIPNRTIARQITEILTKYDCV